MSSGHMRDDHRGLRGRLAGLFSSASAQNGQDEQVAKLMEELQRQRDLKETYKARLESTQGYLRFCLEVAQEHGFLHLMSDNAQRECEPASMEEDEDDVEGDEQAETPSCDPYLAATRDLAVQHGWSVEPDEIELHEVIGQGTTANIHRARWRTYVYMAPEVIRCEPYTEKCDVYSFGVILNELITAEHPYIDTSYGPSKVALEVAAGKLRPRLPETDACPTGLTDLICRSWDAEPSNRPSFATITSTLREIIQQIVQQGQKNLYCNHLSTCLEERLK
ncbi:hypothetical protein EJB05_43230 [Eragrostis curvula]|uniref:Protein kinase domain-containing protein n=1 Tax=Eragrostis curvula TaxID=38414 RepID=A0A5J9TEW0_9POAL|nr:hypothetical protein EJB05_43230 [Eragrostis curvula]